MKKYWFSAFIAVAILLSGEIKKTILFDENQIELIESPASIGIPENPQARLDYELAMIKDPQTGKPIPDHRKKEIQFIEKSKKSNFASKVETQNWRSLGPINVGGRTRGFQMDVLDRETLLAGSVNGGVWKSEDFGQSWKRTSGLLQNMDVTSLVQDTRPGKENTWYYGTGELRGNTGRSGSALVRGDGIFKSTDNGESWESLSATAGGISSVFNNQFQYIWNLAVNTSRSDINEVIAATYGGILRSIDGGQTWEVVLGENLNNQALDLNTENAPFYTDIHITNDGKYFATLSSVSVQNIYQDFGFYYSEDGINWQEITPQNFPPQTERTVISTAKNENIAYFLTTFDDNDFLWKLDFTNGAFDWTNLTANIPEFDVDQGEFDTQGSFNMLVAIDPENTNIVYLGGTNLYRSTDGFTTDRNTNWIGGYTPEGGAARYENHHPDQHVLRFLPENPNVLLSVNDAGVFITQDAAADEVAWSPLNNGYITTQFYTVAMQKDDDNDFIIGGLQDNGTYIRPNSPRPIWSRFFGGDGAFCYITKENRYWYFSFQNSRIFRVTVRNSDLSVTGFARVDPVNGGDGAIDYLFINPFIIDPQEENVMYLAGGDRIWRNDNLEQIPVGSNDPATRNWNQLNNSVTVESTGGSITRFDGQVTALDIAKEEIGDKLYYGTSSGKLFKIRNPRTNISQVDDITSVEFPLEGYIANITVNEDNPQEVLVVFSNHNVRSLFRSTNGGSSFQHISGNLEENNDGSGNGPSVRWVEVAPLADGSNKYFVGTSAGLFSTDQINGDNTIWVQEGADVIGNAVIRMMDYRPFDGRLVVATHGNGVFETAIENQKLPANQTGEFGFGIESIYPNPLTSTDGSSRIIYTIPETGAVKIDVFQSTGQLVTTLIWNIQAKGRNQIFWDGTNNTGSPVPNGVYFFRIRYSTEKLGGRLIINR